jgi:hypothetical protein
MKTSKLCTISGMFALALIVTLALTACPAPTTTSGTVTREFNDLTFQGKSDIKLIDKTGGATDLKASGIHGKVQAALNATTLSPAGVTKFGTIYAAGDFAIVVESGTTYDYCVVDGHIIKIHVDYINSAATTAGVLGSSIAIAIQSDMAVLTPTPTRIAKATQTQRSI